MKKVFMCMIAAFALLACGHGNEPENPKDDNKPEEKEEMLSPSMTLEQVSNIALHTCLSQNYVTEIFEIASMQWLDYQSTNDSKQSAKRVIGSAKENGPEITWSELSGLLIVDYGTMGVVIENGDIIKGKYAIGCGGNYAEKGSRVAIVTEDFSINDVSISCGMEIDNLGADADGNCVFVVKIPDGKIQYADDTISYEFKEQTHRTWIVPGDTLNYYEHSYNIDVIKAVSIANEQWFNFKTYNEDLLVVPVASYPTAGTLSVTLKEPVIIDFSKFIPGTEDSNKFTLETFYVKFGEDSEITVGIMLPYMMEMIELYKVKMSDFR